MRRKTTYGAAISEPERCSARIENCPGFGGGFRYSASRGHFAVDRGLLVRFRQKVEDLDYVRVKIDVPGPLDIRGVSRERWPLPERCGESPVRCQPAAVRQLARFLDQQSVSRRRREVRDEARRLFGMPCRREDGDASQVGKRKLIARCSSISRRHRRHIIAKTANLELVQLLHEPWPDDLHRNS